MSAQNRANLYTKLLRVAKNHYEPVKPLSDRSTLDHLLYACCLENATYEAADEAFARVQQDFFEWNEVRVTTAVELAETMNCLFEPGRAATRFKKSLQSVFESRYEYDLGHLKKENLKKAISILEKFRGPSQFVVSYVAQTVLGGHSIPLDNAMVNLMYIVGAIEESEKEKGVVPGLERAIPKTKGADFFSLVHQMAVALQSSPFNTDIRNIVQQVSASAKDRFPKRGGRKKKVAVESKPKSKVTKKQTAAKVKAKPATGKAPPKKTAAKKSKTAKAPARGLSNGKKKITKKKKAAAKSKSPTARVARKKPR